ncbi:MAG: HDOD domain-containing protein [Pseudomonadales bacterium]
MRSAKVVPIVAHSYKESLEHQLRKSIEAGDVDLPVLPAVGARVLELTHSEDSSAQELAALIQSDQALAGHVMRMANSAAFGGVGKIQTLQQAIAKLGMRQLGQIALTVSVGQSLFEGDELIQDRARDLWRHALASAAWSREIARIARFNTELAYLAGLLHQVGKAVALRNLVKIQRQQGGAIDEQAFAELLDIYHKVLGVNLARRWQLPEAVVESINYVDAYYGAPSERDIVMAVHGARTLATASVERLGESGLEKVFPGQTIFVDLNFYREELAQLVARSESIDQLLCSMTL